MATSPNRRQRIIEYATPKISDLVVVELVDCSKNNASLKAADDNTYGSFHPDKKKFPNFKLSLIKNADDKQGQFQNWYYIKDRAEQDKYNWEFQAAGGANPLYDTVVRTYVLPRYGSGTDGAPDKKYDDNGDKTSVDQVAGVDYFDEALPAINENMPTTTHDPFGEGLGDASPAIDDKYVLFEKKQVRSGDESLDSLFVIEQRIYVKKIPIRRVDVDSEFNRPLRSKETIFYKSETPKLTTEFASSEDDKTSDASGTTEQVFKKNELSSSYFGTFHLQNNEDGVSGSGENAIKYGILREGRQLSDNWYAVSEREVIRTDGNALVRSYFTYQNFTWPAVLDRIADENWTRRDGGIDTIVYPIYKRGAYSGPTKIKVELYWNAAALAVGTAKDEGPGNLSLINPMLPEPLVFQSPIASVNVPPTLHGQINIVATTGSNHPVYNYAGTRWLYLATNYPDWPTELVIADSQRPYRGGYLREKITAYRPEPGT
jgi:hypothetical protein